MKNNIYIDKFKKSKALFILMLFLTVLGGKVQAQGVDVIFWMDNSNSIDATEWNNMSASTRSLIDEVIGCNPYNRVAVVHYGGPPFIANDQMIFIETDFTNNATLAKGFIRRSSVLGLIDFTSQSLTLIGDALDGVTNPNIVSTQKVLTQNPSNKLVIFLFTDAVRDNAGNYYLVSPGSDPFVVYNQFKSGREATFVVLHAPSGFPSHDPAARAAAAAIASVGGSFNGTVEANAGDPQGSGVKPRKFIQSSTFTVSAADLAQLEEDICSSCVPLVELDAVTPPAQEVCLNDIAAPLVADATGGGTLSYQWYSNTTASTTGGTLIPGATADTYGPPTTVLGTTYYYVIVSDTSCEGVATSDVVSVTVTDVDCSQPFECAINEPGLGRIYLTEAQATGTQLYLLYHWDYVKVPVGDTNHGIWYHAIGYNRADDYIYALSQQNSVRKLYRIGSDGVPVDLGTVTGLAAGVNYICGGVANGKMIVKQNNLITDFEVIDLTTLAVTPLSAHGHNMGDITYSEADDKLYFVSRGKGTIGSPEAGHLVSIDVTTGAEYVFPYDNTAVLGGVNIGGMYSSATGKIFGINNDGEVFMFSTNPAYGQATKIATIAGGNPGSYDATACLSDWCDDMPAMGAPDSYTETGISNLEGFTGGWPGNVPNGFIAIESKNKGFVITRVASVAAITNPVEGMLVYDIADACVKLYNGTFWNCIAPIDCDN